MPQETSKQMIDHKQASYHNYENASEGIAGSASLNYPGLEGKYTILEKVGRGAQGTVFKAETISGRIVAIKVFDFREAERWKDVDLLKREVDTLKKLDISGIPKFIEFIEKEPYSYLVESYIEGTSLKDMIADGFEPTFAQIVEIFTRAMNILKNLHGQLHPVIHRDIKPGNLIVNLKSDDIRVWIVDFGTVAAARQRTNASTFAGTAGYLAPEQLFGKATPASDIYAMGMTMVHLISGVAPCDMEMDGLTLKYDKYLPTTLPKTFKDLLAEMVAPNPNDRIKDAESVLRRLKTFAPVVNNRSEREIVTPPASQTTKTTKPNDVVQESDVKDALSKLEKYHQYSLKEKENIFRELCGCYECKGVSLDVIVEQIKIVMDITRSNAIDFPAECVIMTVLNLIEKQHLNEEKLTLLNKLDDYSQYSMKDKEMLLWKCYSEVCNEGFDVRGLSFDVIIECVKNVLDSAQERSLELSLESLIDATIQRVKKQNKLRQKKMPEELELYAAVDSFDGYTREERKDIVIQLYRKTGMNCSDIVRFIKREQSFFKFIKQGKDNFIRSVELSIRIQGSKLFKDPNEKEKSVLDEIYAVLADYKKCNDERKCQSDKDNRADQTCIDYPKDSGINKTKDVDRDNLPRICGCPEFMQPGFTEMQVLELYAARLEVFDKYSLEERKEMIIKCWDHTREDLDQILHVLTNVLSEYQAKCRISDIISKAEVMLNQMRVHRISLRPASEELKKWVNAFEGFSGQDREYILVYLYQETGRSCEKIVDAIRRVQARQRINIRDLLIAAARDEIFLGEDSAYKQVIATHASTGDDDSSGAAIAHTEEGRQILASLDHVEAPMSSVGVIFLFASLLAVLVGAGWGVYYLFLNAGLFWGTTVSIVFGSLLLHIILLIFENESDLLKIFMVTVPIGILIALFSWSIWAGVLCVIGFFLFVFPVIVEFKK